MRLGKFNFKFIPKTFSTLVNNFIINFFLFLLVIRKSLDSKSSFMAEHYFIFHSSCSIFENFVLAGIVSAIIEIRRLKGN